METPIVQMYHCSSYFYIPRRRGLNNAGTSPKYKIRGFIHLRHSHCGSNLNKINIPHLYSDVALRSCLVPKVCACLCILCERILISIRLFFTSKRRDSTRKWKVQKLKVILESWGQSIQYPQ